MRIAIGLAGTLGDFSNWAVAKSGECREKVSCTIKSARLRSILSAATLQWRLKAEKPWLSRPEHYRPAIWITSTSKRTHPCHFATGDRPGRSLSILVHPEFVVADETRTAQSEGDRLRMAGELVCPNKGEKQGALD